MENYGKQLTDSHGVDVMDRRPIHVVLRSDGIYLGIGHGRCIYLMLKHDVDSYEGVFVDSTHWWKHEGRQFLVYRGGVLSDLSEGLRKGIGHSPPPVCAFMPSCPPLNGEYVPHHVRLAVKAAPAGRKSSSGSGKAESPGSDAGSQHAEAGGSDWRLAAPEDVSIDIDAETGHMVLSKRVRLPGASHSSTQTHRSSYSVSAKEGKCRCAAEVLEHLGTGSVYSFGTVLVVVEASEDYLLTPAVFRLQM